MHIEQTRIRTHRTLTGLEDGTTFRVALLHIDGHREALVDAGFVELDIGEKVLPAVDGPVSNRNANGRTVVHRDQPMETAYRQVRWSWTEYHGPNRVEQEETKDVSYKRYPRTQLPPYAVELTIVDRDGDPIVVSDPVEYVDDNEELIVHSVNLFLELFGQCDILDVDLDPVTVPVTRRLNWTVLPEGEYPWERTREELETVVNRAPEGNRPVIWERLETIAAHEPDFTAVGRGGFAGYVVFGFEDRSIYVLESAFYGNATYVLGDDWQRLSQLTKAELLDRDLHEQRIIHRADSWRPAIHSLLREA